MAFAAKFAKKGLAMQLQVEEPAPAAVSFNVTDSGTFCTGDGAINITAHGISGLPSTFTLSDLDDVCELGRGTCSIVRRVRHRASSTDLALKPISIGDKEHRAQLRAEISALAGNSHPNILQLYNAFFDERSGLVYFACELMDLGDLEGLIRRVAPVPEAVVSVITRQLLLGLSHCHEVRGSIHRDIKPANILVHSSGYIKISDFGMSKAHLKDAVASSVGTLYYMSPERCLSNEYSFNADIWSLGCCVYELAFGRHPFAPAPGAPAHLSVVELAQDVCTTEPPYPENASPIVVDFIKHCLIKQREARPQASHMLQHPLVQAHGAVSHAQLAQWFACVPK